MLCKILQRHFPGSSCFALRFLWIKCTFDFFQFQYAACSHLGTRSEESRNTALQPILRGLPQKWQSMARLKWLKRPGVDTTVATDITFKLRIWLEWVDGDVAISNLVMVLRPSQQRIQWKDCSASWYSNARCNLQAEAVASPALDNLKQEVGVTFSAGCQQKPTKGTFVAA